MGIPRKIYLWIRRKSENEIKKIKLKDFKYKHSLNLNIKDYDFGKQYLSSIIDKKSLDQSLSGTVIIIYWGGSKLEITFSTKDADMTFHLKNEE